MPASLFTREPYPNGQPNVPLIELTKFLEYLHDKKDARRLSVVDVGAGQSPYKQLLINANLDYFSHDFSEYSPDLAEVGYKESHWEYAPHDWVCDILDFEPNRSFDVVICTEVFEHIPDPVRAFEKLASVISPGGHVFVSVPLISLIHQAPFYFQSGLSPFWFNYWAEKFQIEILENKVVGDYTDLIRQELGRLIERGDENRLQRKWKFAVANRFLKNNLSDFVSFNVRSLPKEAIESGGLNVIFIGQKSQS